MHSNTPDSVDISYNEVGLISGDFGDSNDDTDLTGDKRSMTYFKKEGGEINKNNP